MKILLVTPEFPPDFGGGIGVYCGDLALELKAQGCEVGVLKGSAFVHGVEPYAHDGLGVAMLDREQFHKWLGRFDHFGMFPDMQRHLAAAFAMHEQAREGEGYDAVEVSDWGFLYLPWVLRSQAKVLVQLHGSNGQIAYHEPIAGREVEGAVSLLLDKSALETAPALSSQSQANANWWENFLGRHAGYLPLGIKLGELDSGSKNLGENWLCVGRIQHWKGPQVACAAWELLGDNAPKLEWVGRDMPHGASVLSTSEWLGQQFPAIWGAKIQPVGRIPADQWLQRMLAARAVLIPSLWDVLNRAALEAMALGKVVVISDGAGAADFVQNGVNGFVFTKGDNTALAKLVRQVQSMSGDELHRMGQRAARTIREQLDPARIATAKIELYRNLPASAASGTSWIRECLLPEKRRKPLAFLDGLPLKDLSEYVMRRGLAKLGGRKV